MEQETIEQITKGMTDAVEKALPELVEKTVNAKIKEIADESKEEVEEIKEEVKNLKMNAMATKTLDSNFQKEAVVKIFKEVMNNNITTEKGFNDATERVLKTMTEGTATEGAELVFDQFEADVLRVINTFDILADVKILPLAKGDKVSLPKATNGITTYFVDEGDDITGVTKPATAFVTIDIAKAMTLTDMTQELLDDTMTAPDLYNLIVEFIGESQGEFLERQILIGTGSVKGVLVNASVNKVFLGSGNTAEDISDTTIIDVITKAARKFKKGGKCKFYMSQYVFGKVKALLTTDGYPVYPEMRSATPSIMGYPVVMSDVWFVQNSTEDIAGGITMLFGDLSYFTLARRKGITIERGYYGDNWAKGIQSIKSNSRYGGCATFPEAFTIVKNGASS